MQAKSILIAFLSILCSSTFGQRSKLIQTTEENEKWLDSLGSVQLVEQASMIKCRILLDTNVFVREYYPDGIKIVDSLGGRVYGVRKPLILVNGVPIVIKNDTNREEIVKLAELMSEKIVRKVVPVKANPKDQAIYGLNAINGTVFLELKRKKYLKRFKRLQLS